jgi:hypothetical protein
MIPKGISQASLPNPRKYTLEKEIQCAIFVVLIRKYEAPLLLKFYYSIRKYFVSYADS